ncbi:MAG: Tol-Pal system protein TolB, partial [Alphaproteobacteria bacterium]|nr:Tol-Pal system protein TolB [Alphaproteobacteria bacterium]
MMRIIKTVFPVFSCLYLVLCSMAQAALDIKITKGTLAPIPIAIPTLEGGSSFEKKMAEQIRKIILQDLENCGLFQLIPESAYIQKIETLQQSPHYSEWRLIKADNLVSGKVIDASGGQIRVEFRVFDTVREVQIEGKAYVGREEDWRRVAHKVADAIYSRLIGDDGYFDTQVVYV